MENAISNAAESIQKEILNSRILLVDDEADILEFLSYNLEKQGYTTYQCDNGRKAIELAKQIRPQLIVLDIMMPDMDGVEACKELRAIPELQKTMIAFLTARSEEYSEIACLEAGGDDFITKPVRPRLFLSHVKALLRRYYLMSNTNDRSTIKVGEIELNLESYRVTKGGENIHLTKKEMDLLSLLMSKPNKVFLRYEIISKIWGQETIVGDRTIDVHISKLREKLGKEYIKTVKSVGYKFI